MITIRVLGAPGGFRLVGSPRAVPGVTTPDEVIDGFPEFAFTLDTIRGTTVDDKLTRLAKRIVASHASGSRRIIGFEVHGHADQTVRLTGAERERAELEVSRDRAEHAKDLLLEKIKKEGGAPIITGISANTEARGFGSAHRVFRPATTSAQMERNRRVEIFLKEFVEPPPKPSPPPPPPKPEVRSRFRVQIKSGLIIFFSTPVPGTALTVRLSLKLVLTDLDRKEQAKFNATLLGKALPPSFPGATTPNATVNVGEGPSTDFNALEGMTLARFSGALAIGQNPGIAGVGVGGQFVFFFEALPGPTRPNPVTVAGGNVIGVPQFGLGISPQNGKFEMEGQPTKTN